MRITGSEFGKSVTNPNDWPAVERVFGEAAYPASVNNCIAAKTAEPILGTQRWRGRVCHVR
jgi:hypothetical protein